MDRPTEDQSDKRFTPTLLGWRWSRHSMENYMLEPGIICAALSQDLDVYRDALIQGGDAIKYYQAARWAIGKVRQSLPPSYKLQTGVDEKKDFLIPVKDELSRDKSNRWLIDQVQTFATQILPKLEQAAIVKSFDEYANLFEAQVINSHSSILTYFSGKDLMTALKPWWSPLKIQGPGDFRARIRDWMIANPESVLGFLPEWQVLLDVMQNT
ncbi:hypothetical protein [Desulfatibacillum aliphaticivorans]|uniref:hypothetical protein n=1 Tax=Desulfatibacillum aliphaticivorans TaxID=218208 RepID=UPI0014720ACF|nr:hypothetical protein [Desulfatibacillum aliphaticivorans]